MQIDFEEFDGFEDNIENTYAFIQMMLECNYHLLNAFLINREMRYLVEFYLSEKNIEAKKLRKEFKDLIRNSKIKLTRQPRSLINNYKLKWIFK